jgi:DNA-directed RNA polymerase subunit K/omega
MDDTVGKFLGCDFPNRQFPLRFGDSVLVSVILALAKLMKPSLVQAASDVITNQQILVNMVSRRVRQLCLGHRSLVEFVPGLGHADIALSEIAAGKLIFESTLGQNGKNGATHVVEFPRIIVEKKTKTKKKAA